MRARLDDSINLADNPTLFGSLRIPSLVSVHSDRKGQIRTYRRVEDEIECEEVDFRPFLWVSDLDLLKGTKVQVETQELEGDNLFRYLLHFDSWSECKEVSDHISTLSGRYASHPDSPQLFINDQATQYLLATGQTYYNKMAIEEVHTLILRVYTAGEVSDDPGEDPNRIVAVALRQGSDGECVLIDDEEESKLLWHLSGKVKKIDPDLIQGHNLFKRDLQLISDRCKAQKVKFGWGRGGETVSGRKTRMMVAEKQLDYRRFWIAGREFADSWILSILHDVSGREMTGYDLDDVADHFGLELGQRKDPLSKRAELDTKAIALLHRNLIYPYFLQSQIFPLSFENVILRGNATRINHIFLREYYRLRHSIPGKPEVVPFAGGLTAQEHEGCAYGVFHCDVASLYPSLIIAYDLGPAVDKLDIFKGLLETLRDFRFLAKKKQKDATSEVEAAFFGNLQTTFKILINSFYGYLGFGQGHFADFDRAAEVTRLGRELLTKMMDHLRDKGAQILEVDTDGIYFVPSDEFANADWIELLNEELPEGVQVEFDGRYPGMYCHKMKNYALLEEDGHLVLRGSGLRSRALEPFLRRFIEDMIRAALTEGNGAHQKVFEDYEERLKAGEFGVDDLCKTETLIDSPATYSRKIEKGGRNRAAVYELALAAERKYHAGENLSYYVTGSKATVTVYDNCKRVQEFDPDEPDINAKYYVKKLKASFKKFDPILSKPEKKSPLPFNRLPEPVS
jgi:DNA polymerase I